VPFPVGGRIVETNGATQIAMLVDFYERQTAMLFVIRTKTAIVGTAFVNLGLKLEWNVARLPEFAT
jgi:hypothetical protein